MRSMKDLSRLVEFRRLVPLLSQYRGLMDTGKLAEWYCVKLFGLRLVMPRNRKGADALGSRGERIEIKHRFFSGRTPPGMRMKRDDVDYVLYVELAKDLIPRRILRIASRDLVSMSDGRISFRNAVDRGRARLVFSREEDRLEQRKGL